MASEPDVPPEAHTLPSYSDLSTATTIRSTTSIASAKKGKGQRRRSHCARNWREWCKCLSALVLLGLFICAFIPIIFLMKKQPMDPCNIPHWTINTDRQAPIPNIVHYVRLRDDVNSELSFSFRDFVSLYATQLYLGPTTTIIHHDYNDTMIATARKSPNLWTQKVFSTFSDIQWRRVEEVLLIDGYRSYSHARSDFLRQEVLAKYGGVYMDWNVVPLKDIKALRHAGFQAVVGRQHGGQINNGVILAHNASALTHLMMAEGPRHFNGERPKHTTELITRVAERLSTVPGEVLILDEKAFAPTN